MSERKITIAGNEVPVQFCGATLISFEEITGHPFFSDRLDTQSSRIALIYAAVYTANNKTDMTVETLMFDASWQELNDSFTIVMEASTEFFGIPDVMKEADKPSDEEKEGKVKN